MILNALYQPKQNDAQFLMTTRGPIQIEYCNWTKEEIDDYTPTRNLQLKQLYGQKNLITPEERARFLSETFLDLEKDELEVILKIGTNNSRGIALCCLEQWAEDFIKQCFS